MINSARLLESKVYWPLIDVTASPATELVIHQFHRGRGTQSITTVLQLLSILDKY